MGRNKKGNKHRKINQLSKKSIKSFMVSLLLCSFIYMVILLITGYLRLGSFWEIWKVNGQYIPLIVSLSLYRITEYTLPAIIIKFAFKKMWREAFNYQFACYALLNAGAFLLGLDYAFGIELFSSADSFIIIIGYIISLAVKENVSLENTVNVALTDNTIESKNS